MRTSSSERYASFELDGVGPAVIAIPSGPGFSSATLRPWLVPLARNHTIATVELPGTGDASKDTGQDYSFAAFVADLAAVQTAIGGGRATVLGHGWGAAMAVEYALAQPELVSSLVLVSPLRIFTAAGQDSVAQARMVDYVDATLIERWSDLQPQFVAALKGEARWDPVEEHGWWSEMVRTQFASPPPPAWDAAMARARWGLRAYATYKGAAMFDPVSEVARYDLAERALLLPSNLPVLIISSDHDANYVAPAARHAAALANSLPQAQLVHWDDVGHFPFVERTDDFTTIVRDFLDSASLTQPIHALSTTTMAHPGAS